MLQQRAGGKYHSALQWSNACCTHPNRGETTIEAAYRRLDEEMGFCTSLQHLLTFQYRAVLDNGLIEHELDHVYLGTFNGKPNPNPEEVSEWKYMSPEEIYIRKPPFARFIYTFGLKDLELNICLHSRERFI